MANTNEFAKDETVKSPSPRGFAAMDPQKQKEIASKGGKASHESGNAHEFTPEEAREAGRKGGMARSKTSVNGISTGATNGNGGTEAS